MKPPLIKSILLIALLVVSRIAFSQNCPPPSNLYSEPLTFSSAKFEWSATAGTVSFYQLYIREKGTNDWENHTITTNSIKLFDLEQGFVYEWKVRVKCEMTSGYLSKNNFTSLNELYMPIQKITESNLLPPALSVFPNPAMNDIKVELSVPHIESGIATFELVNIMGQVAQSQSLAVENGSINAIVQLDQSITSGWYIFRLSAGNKIYQKNLVVTR